MTATTTSQPRADARRATGNTRMSLLLLVGLALSIATLHSVLDGILWWFVAVLAMVLVLGSAAVTRAFSRQAWLPTIVGFFIALGATTVFFTPHTAFLGIFPTLESWQEFAEFGGLGMASIEGQSLPAEATSGILFLIFWIGATLALLMDALAIWLRAPAISGIPLLVVISVPSFVLSELADPFLFALTAVVYLLILRPSLGRVQPGAAVGVGAIGIIGSLVLPIVLPPVNPAEAGSGVSALSARLNPIVSLGRDLRQPEPTLALTYMTTSPAGQYLRLTTLEEFRGEDWQPVSIERIAGNEVDAIGPPKGLGADVRSEVVSTTIRIGNVTGRWLPVPYPATSVTGLEGDWFWEPDGLSVRAQDSNMRGQDYTVESLKLRPTADQLAAAPSSAASRLAQLPDVVDPRIGELALQVVEGAANDYEKAVALQRWFRGGTFLYSEEAPVREEFDGSGLDVLMPFLEARAGYCVHFASTMAVMARTLGIPSRIAVGFLPGAANALEGVNIVEYRVSSTDLHAWPELYFEGVGWVPFEPTPGRGVAANFPSAAEVDTGAPDPSNPNEGLDPDRDPVAADGPELPRDDKSDLPLAGVDAQVVATPWTAVSLLGLLLVLLVPAFVRLAIRSRRFTALHRGGAPATMAWLEIAATARDLGHELPYASTARELEQQLQQAEGLSDAARASLAKLRAAVELEAYAGDGRSSNSNDATVRALWTVLNALTRAAPLRAQLRGFVAPVTLLELARVRQAGARGTA